MYSEEVLKRLKEAVSFLKYEKGLKTQSAIADKLDYNNSNLSQVLKGNDRYLTDAFLKKFVKTFPQIDVKWLLNGVGELNPNRSKIEVDGFPLDETVFEDEEKIGALVKFLSLFHHKLKEDKGYITFLDRIKKEFENEETIKKIRDGLSDE